MIKHNPYYSKPTNKSKQAGWIAVAVLGLQTLTFCQMPQAQDRQNFGAYLLDNTKNTSANANANTNAVVLQMANAFKRNDSRTLSALLPQMQNHPLEGWAAYWELKARFSHATQPATENEIQAFLSKFADTYYADRLRNDWLLQLGKQRNWDAFNLHYPLFKMRDDKEVACYAAIASASQSLNTRNGNNGSSDSGVGLTVTTNNATVKQNWWSQKDADGGCSLAAQFFLVKTEPNAIWRKARLATSQNRPFLAQTVIQLLPQPLDATEMTTLSLLKIAVTESDKVVQLLLKNGIHQNQALDMGALRTEQKDWLWGTLATQAAMGLNAQAVEYINHVENLNHLSDEMLAWATRAVLRTTANTNPQQANTAWIRTLELIEAMGSDTRNEAVWVYWRARALQALATPIQSQTDANAIDVTKLAQAETLFKSIASANSGRGFYEQLAAEELGQLTVASTTQLPSFVPIKATKADADAIKRNTGLQRAMFAINIGLRSEGVREWNFTTNSATKGGMSDGELLAAAQLACDAKIWDRCINTSERTKSIQAVDFNQRFPMPFQQLTIQYSQKIGLDPAYVYGLMRQESRFIARAQSGVGASGLMQVMPATARWTAKKMGFSDYKDEQLNDQNTNIAIGTAYLKLVLDDLDGSLPLAAAAYNAGPGRPRKWRNGPTLEGAIWAENIPFSETRDYVKKVLSNTNQYAAVLTGKPQSLKKRLGMVGPRNSGSTAENVSLP